MHRGWFNLYSMRLCYNRTITKDLKPSREVVDLKRQRLDLSKNVPILETYEGDFQYISPSNYR